MFLNNIIVLVPRQFFLHRSLIKKQDWPRPALDTPKQEESLQTGKKKKKKKKNYYKSKKTSKSFKKIFKYKCISFLKKSISIRNC